MITTLISLVLAGWALSSVSQGAFVVQEHAAKPTDPPRDGGKLNPAPVSATRDGIKIESKKKKFDSTEDSWEGEIFNDLTGSQLKALGKLIEHPENLDEAHVAKFGAPTYASADLRPTNLVEVYKNSSATVLRPKVFGAELRDRSATLEGIGGLLSGLKALSASFGDSRNVQTKFKIIGVDATGERIQTRAYYSAWGRGPTGWVQQIATWSMRWVRGQGQSPPLLEWIGIEDYEEVIGPATGQPWFEECTLSVFAAAPSFAQQLHPGLDSWLASMDSALGLSLLGHEGLAVADVNGDGLEDLFVCQPGGLPNLLYVQQPDGTLKDRTREAGLDLLNTTHAALFVDVDNDGDQDLVLATDVGVLFYASDGKAAFKRMAKIEMKDSSSLSAADFDLDGDLDIYCTGYFSPEEESKLPVPYHDANNGTPNIMLRNDGGWKFRDITEEVGLNVNNKRFSFASSWEDYDNDGDPDLYVSNDFGRNNLYRNDKGRFVDVASEAGVEDISAGMGVTWADYNRDGLMDLYVSNMFSSAGSRVTYQRQFKTQLDAETKSQFQRHARGNSLFENMGDGTFRDVSETAAVTMGRWAWGAIFADLNNDGWEDIVVPNGFVSNEDTKDL